ncbi:hypothetical protein OHB12_04890 [Nocardia sp. NBC_01730]|uniref:hypothetical protein n=1 Tax=Nocardia sp. NBC_01730 TaxID=2975998 RepID=UPI002E0EAC26|nr:hypothetical protein OHB12_04890 [Nocardia sp. NBC_01730]
MTAMRGHARLGSVSPGRAEMRPLMIGYLRQELVGDHLAATESALREFATVDGFELAEIFVEQGPTTGALWQLTQTVRATQSRHIITPTPTHMDGGGNPERNKLLGDLLHQRRNIRIEVWYLDPNDDEALRRARRRYRDIPASPDTPTPTEPRTLIGCFELQAVSRAAATAQLRIHELLTRVHLRHLVESTERVVLAVLAEATTVAAAAEPEIFARLTTSCPVLSPPNNVLTVWLSRSADALEVHVYETVSHAEQAASPAVLAAAHGRHTLSTGGTLTWARFPLTAAQPAVPAVLHSSIAGDAEHEPMRACPPQYGTPALCGPSRIHRTGAAHWGTGTTYESPAVGERNGPPSAGHQASRNPADPSDWNHR